MGVLVAGQTLVVAVVNRAVVLAWIRETAYLTAALALCMGVLYGVHRRVYLVGFAAGHAVGVKQAPPINLASRVVKDSKTGRIQYLILECVP